MPFTYSPEDRERITRGVCERITQGELTKEACKAEGITFPTWLAWCAKDSDLLDRYTRAKATAADAIAEQAVAIARDTTPETAQADRLRYDALRWLAGKRRPKDYGETRQVDVNQTVTLINPDERDARLTALLLKAGLPKLTATARLAEPDASEAQQEG